MAIQIGGFQSQQEFDDDLNSIFPGSSSFSVGNQNLNFSTRREQMPDGSTRVVINNADYPKSDPLLFDVRPGPRIGKSQSAIVLDYSEKGSQYKRAITNEVFFNSEKPDLRKGDVRIRRPLEALRDYAYGSFFVPGFRASGQQGKFSHLLNQGDSTQQLAGGLLNISPLISSSATQSLARNVTVGFGKSVKNAGDAVTLMNSWINPRGDQPSPALGDFFKDMAGLVPYKGDDDKIRYHPANESIPEINSANAYSWWHLGKATNIAKGHNAARGEREQLSEKGMYQINPETGFLTPFVPKIITDMQSQGTSRLNIQFGEGFAPSAAISRSVLRAPGLPDSGARVTWGQTGTDVQGEIGPFFPTNESRNLYPTNSDELINRTSFQWGIFNQNKNGSWTRESDLTGYALQPKQRVTIGLQTVIDQAYPDDINKRVVTPIDYTNDNRISVIRGLPTLNLPPALDPVLGTFAPISGNLQTSQGSSDNRLLNETEMQKLRANMSGGEVNASTIGSTTLSIPLATENAVGEKQYGVKQSIIQDFGVTGEQPRDRTVRIGDQEVRLQSITASVKNPLLQFIYGQVGSMPTSKIRQLVSETYGNRSPLLKEIDSTIKLQSDLLNNTALTNDERSQQWRGVDIEKLALIESKRAKNAELANPLLFARDFRNRTLEAMRKNPQRFLSEYQMGEMTQPEYVDYRTIDTAEIAYQRDRLRSATQLLTEENPSLYPKDKMDALNSLDSSESMYKFESIEGRPNLSKWSIKTSGAVGTIAAGLVTEHMYKDNPRLSLEEMMTVVSQYPENVAQIIRDQSGRLENLGTKAWKSMYTYYQGMQSSKTTGDNKPLIVGDDYTTLSAGQASAILGKISGLKGNNPDLMQNALDETLGKQSASLLRMETSGNVFPSPQTLKGVSEMDVIDGEQVINIDRLSKTYTPALMDFLGQKNESQSSKMAQFNQQIFNALGAAGGGLIKKFESTPVVGGGGHMGGATGLNPNVGVVSESSMRRYILEGLKASNIKQVRDVDPHNLKNITEEQSKFLDQAYNLVQKQGGLPVLYTKPPPYTREGSVLPMILRDARMVREQGLNMPDATSVKNGRIQSGASNLWGLTGLVGQTKEQTFADTDLDPGTFTSVMPWDINKNDRLSSSLPSKDFFNLANQSGQEILSKINKTLKSVSGGNSIGTVSAPVKEMVDAIKGLSSQEFLNEDKLTKISQIDASKMAKESIGLKQQMGVAFNTRRRIESVMEADPSISQEDLDTQYNSLGLSYEKHLEMTIPVPERPYEKFIQSFTPYAKKIENSTEKQFGFQYSYRTTYDPATGKEKPVFENTSSTNSNNSLDFNNGGLILSYQSAAEQSVFKGVLNPEAALGMFSRGSDRLKTMTDEFNQNPENRSSTEAMNAAVSGIITKEISQKGFDFGETEIGKTLAAVLVDKLQGESGPVYKLPAGSIAPGQNALKHLKGENITYQGKTTTVGEFLENPMLKAANTIYKAEKRKTGVITANELYDLDVYNEQNSNQKQLTRHLLDKFGAADVRKAFDEPGVHYKGAIDLEAFQNYRPSPNELTKVLNLKDTWRADTMQKIFAKTQLALPGNIGDYTAKDKTFMELGVKFEEDFADKIIKQQGIESAYRPTDNMSVGATGTIFDWKSKQYRPDVMGIDPKSGMFVNPDLKWLGSKTSAENVANDPAFSRPQLVATSDPIYRMAHPEKYLDNWEEVKTALGDNPEENYFVSEMVNSVRGDGQRALGKEELSTLRDSASKWFNAIRNKGIDTQTWTGYGGIDENDVPMQFHKSTTWGSYTPEEAELLNAESQQVMQSTTPQDIINIADSLDLDITSAAGKPNIRTLPRRQADLLKSIVNPNFAQRPVGSGSVSNVQSQSTNIANAGSGSNDSGEGDISTGGGKGGGSGIPAVPFPEYKKNSFMWDASRKSTAAFVEEWGKSLAPYLAGGEQTARTYSAKQLDRTILEGRFGTGVIAAERLTEQQTYLKDLPKNLVASTSQALIAKGFQPTVTYNESMDRYSVNGSWTSAANAMPEILNQFAQVETVDNAAYKTIAGEQFEAARDVTRDFKDVQQGYKSAQEMGVSPDNNPGWFAAMQNMKTVQETPGISTALALAGAIAKPSNKPAGVRADDTEEKVQATVRDFERFANKDVLGDFTTQIEKVTKKVDGLSKSIDGSTEALDENTKRQRKMNPVQKGILADRISDIDITDRHEPEQEALREANDAYARVTSGKASAKDVSAILKKGTVAASTISKATKTLAAQEQGLQDIEEGDYPGGAKTIGESFRSALGGFGLFYLRTLFSYGFGSYQKGYDATQKQKTLLNQLATTRYGAGATEQYISPELQKQRDLLISGGTTWENIERAGSALFGKNSDVSGAVMSGLGAFAATAHLAPMIASASAALGVAGGGGWAIPSILAAAPTVGLIAGTAMGVFSAVSNGINYDDSIMRAVAADDPTNKGMNLGGFSTFLGPYFKDLWHGNFTTRYGGRKTEAEAKYVDLQYESTLAYEGLATRRHYQVKGSEEFRQTVSEISANPPPALQGLDSNQIAGLFYGHVTGDINSERAVNDYDFIEQLGRIGKAEAAGRNVTGAAQQISILSNMGYTPEGDLGYLEDYFAKMEQYDWEKSVAGMSLMSKVPAQARNFGLESGPNGEISQSVLKTQLDKYSRIASGKYADLFVGHLDAVNTALATGKAIPINEDQYDPNLVDYTPEEAAALSNKDILSKRQSQLRTTLQQSGMAVGTANNFIDNFVGARGTAFAERLLNFSPTAIGDVAQGLKAYGVNDTASYLDQFALTDYNLQGQQTGLGHWATSLRGAASSAVDNANMIWGKGKWENTQLGRAATFGVNRDTGHVYESADAASVAEQHGANVTAGEKGMQYTQYFQGVDYQKQQFGIQQAQFNLQETYRPQFWQQEDKQREFSYRQQEWGFNQQQASTDMQNRQFQQNMGFQQKQSNIQRGWAVEDWGYQDLTRSMQWGWKQEDFAEQSRFMTGRDRKVAERNMERETTMFNLEGGQIDKTRDRQKQSWALEDERFAIQKEQYAEQKKLQEEGLLKQREFFEEQKLLTQESLMLNRQYQLEQIELQKQSLALQATYMTQQNENSKIILDESTKQEEMQGAFALAKEKQIEFFNEMVEGFAFVGVELKQMIQSMLNGTPYTPGTLGENTAESGGGGGGGGGIQERRANGGDMFPGIGYIVGEAGAERVRPRTLGSVVNQYDIAQTLKQTDRWTNRSVFYPSNQSDSPSGGPQTINVYVGNEKLASFVLNTVKSDLEVL